MTLVPREILRIELSCTDKPRARADATHDLSIAEVEAAGRVAIVAECDRERGRDNEREHAETEQVDLELRRADLVCTVSSAIERRRTALLVEPETAGEEATAEDEQALAISGAGGGIGRTFDRIEPTMADWTMPTRPSKSAMIVTMSSTVLPRVTLRGQVGSTLSSALGDSTECRAQSDRDFFGREA